MADSMTKDGGPAFPFQSNDELVGTIYDGMSLRDWFAGQYLAGNKCNGGTADEHASDAYRLADAMLAARVGK